MHLPGVVLNRRIHARALAITLSVGAPAAAQIGATTQADPTPVTPAATSAPRLTQFVQADYPADALAQGLEGSVLLELTVDPTGHVSQVTVVQPLGHGFDEAATAAARTFVFEPARRDGVVVASILRYRYRFSAAAARAAQQPQVHALLRVTVRGRGDQPVWRARRSASRSPTAPPARPPATSAERFASSSTRSAAFASR